MSTNSWGKQKPAVFAAGLHKGRRLPGSFCLSVGRRLSSVAVLRIILRILRVVLGILRIILGIVLAVVLAVVLRILAVIAIIVCHW